MLSLDISLSDYWAYKMQTTIIKRFKFRFKKRLHYVLTLPIFMQFIATMTGLFSNNSLPFSSSCRNELTRTRKVCQIFLHLNYNQLLLICQLQEQSEQLAATPLVNEPRGWQKRAPHNLHSLTFSLGLFFKSFIFYFPKVNNFIFRCIIINSSHLKQRNSWALWKGGS